MKTKTPTINVSPRFSLRLAPIRVVAAVFILSVAAQRTYASPGDLYESDGSGNIYEFTPGGTQSTFASGLNQPFGLAFDSAGNVFEADQFSGNIYEFTPGGTRSTFASGLNNPAGLAFDSAGNLFVADEGSGNIYEFTPGGTQSTFASGLTGPAGLAFDSAGNLFVADLPSGNIYEFTPGGSRSTFASGLDFPTGLAFNSAGNLFEADEGSGNIYEFTPGGTPSTFASGLDFPSGLAFDSAGNLFEADALSGHIYEFAPGGTRSTFASGLSDPIFLAFEPPRPATLGNISTRLQVGTGDRVMIAGFIVQGSSPKMVLIRAIGPSLTNFGVPNVLANPQLELHNANSLIARNDNWQTTQIGGIITSNQVAEIRNSGLAPSNPLESALIATLPPGNYTAIARGVNNTTGNGLAEVYDLSPTSGSLLANLSTRGFVQTGDNVMIGGFIVVTQPTRVIIRAIGPSLTRLGVPAALANPQLELHNANSIIARNDDWQTTQIGGIITSNQVAEIQNSHLAPTNPAESAIIATLQPGNYTAIVRGVNNTTGIALVEVYDLQ
jgi:sugar lactone lactonase YvrE